MRKKRKVLACGSQPAKSRSSVALEATEHKHGRVLLGDKESPIDASDDFLRIAAKYALARARRDVADDELDAAKKLLGELEGFLLEEMGDAAQNVQVVVDVPNVGERRYTIYKIPDTIVRPDTGKNALSIVSACHAVGWDETCNETYSHQTLKAAVKEARKRSTEVEEHRRPWFCNVCQEFFDHEDADVMTEETAECKKCENALIRMEGGIPKLLADVLFIEDITKLGCRTSS